MLVRTGLDLVLAREGLIRGHPAGCAQGLGSRKIRHSRTDGAVAEAIARVGAAVMRTGFRQVLLVILTGRTRKRNVGVMVRC